MTNIKLQHLLTSAAALLLMVGIASGRGLVTNPNQSAEYIRMLNRNASISLDAAYYNPAGLTKIRDGFYVSLNSQTLFVTDKIKSNVPTLNSGKFKGDIRAWVFPDIHVVYKKDKLAYSGSLMPIGGGGGGTYDNGLPSFEYPYAGYVGGPVADFRADDAELGTITSYSANSKFKGASVYFAGQGNVAYSVSDMLSVAIGGRLIGAYNAMEGGVTDVTLRTRSITDPASTSTLAVDDHVMDITQTGIGFTGIVSVHMTHLDHLRIGLRYEFATPLELETHNDNPDTEHFPDGEKTNADMPAMFASGVSYQMSPMMRVEGSFNYYQNSSANWDGAEDDTDDGFEAGLGIEHSMGLWKASAGYLYSKTGATDAYRNDARMALDHHNIGFGVGYQLSDAMEINAGGFTVIFIEDTKTLSALSNNLVPYETYNELLLGFSVGLNYKL